MCIRVCCSSLLGPPPGPVPSLLAAGPLQNSSMMMGRPLENALSQLQRPSIQQPVMAPQVQNQQGMHVSNARNIFVYNDNFKMQVRYIVWSRQKSLMVMSSVTSIGASCLGYISIFKSLLKTHLFTIAFQDLMELRFSIFI